MLYFFGCINQGLAAPAGLAAQFANAASPDQSYAAALFHTGWFVESILTQTLIVHIIRTKKIPFIQSRASPIMLFFTLLIMAIAVYLPYSPLAGFLGFVPLPAIYWAWIAGFLVLYSVLTHFVKSWFFRKFGVD